MTARVLFVDDEPKVLRALGRMLAEEPRDWDVHTAVGVDEALSRIATTEFDVIVTDVNMPHRDGFELLQEIRNGPRTRQIPVVIVTGQDDEALKRRALERGAVDLLCKPVHPQDLLARLRNAVRLKNYEDQLRNQNAILEQRVLERTAELADSQRDIIWKLGKAGEHRDQETGNHVVRVGCYCRVLAQALGTSPAFTETLFLASPLHDIGKIGIPDAILLKRGPLTSAEWDVMRRHCAIGAEILREGSRTMEVYHALFAPLACGRASPERNPILTAAASIALTHHEAWDGSGYPAGLAGEDIPLPARIVALADTYDALRSERPYKPALPEEEASRIIECESGRRLDPQLVLVYRRLTAEFDAIRNALADLPASNVHAEYPT